MQRGFLINLSYLRTGVRKEITLRKSTITKMKSIILFSLLLVFSINGLRQEGALDYLSVDDYCPFVDCFCSKKYHYVDCRKLNNTQFSGLRVNTSWTPTNGMGFNILDLRGTGQKCLPAPWILWTALPELKIVLADRNPDLCCNELADYVRLDLMAPAHPCQHPADDTWRLPTS
jgi:hypothetical protein